MRSKQTNSLLHSPDLEWGLLDNTAIRSFAQAVLIEKDGRRRQFDKAALELKGIR